MSEIIRVLSGIRATGKLHFGNFLGAVQNFVKYQEKERTICLYFIADLHTLTTLDDPEELRKNLIEIVKDYLASGLDPERSIIYTQSSVPEIPELCIYLSMLQPLGELQTIPTFKESQQLSNKAAATIFNRFLSLFPKERVPQPEEILKLSEEILRSCGVSHQKASYLKSLAEEITSQKLVLENLHLLEDEEVVLELTKVKGVGRWTAEMFLIFSLGRQNIFSVGDLGLRSAVAKLYGVNREDKIKIEEISKSWSPYRSLASLYLWKSLENS